MTIGPVSYTVIAFPGNRFNGNIAPEVARLVESGTVRILDLVFVAKDEQGDTISLEFDQMDELAAFGEIDGDVGGLVNAEVVDARPGLLFRPAHTYQVAGDDACNR